MLPGPEKLAFLALCSQPPLNSLARERRSQMKLSFPTPPPAPPAAALSHCLRSSGRSAPRARHRYLAFVQHGRHRQQRTV